MRIAGVEVPAGSVARLAAILHGVRERTLAQRVGRAVDTNVPEIAFSNEERAIILNVLTDAPESLGKLRDAITKERPRKRFRFRHLAGGRDSGPV